MRSGYCDSWKGAAIIAVVLIHASGTTAAFPAESVNNLFGLILRQFINWPVGFFVFLSAWFSARSSRSGPWSAQVLPRMWRLLLPYLVWAAIYLAVRGASGRLDPGQIPRMFLTGTVIEVGYFVIMMVQLTLLAPIFDRLSSRQLAVLLPLSVVVSCGYTYSSRLLDGASGAFPFNALPFFVWLPFHLLGLILG